MSGSRQVGAVDAGVGADEAVLGLDDEDAALGPQHLAALLEDQLDQRRLLAEHRGELARLGARQHRGELADLALRLGDDLLGDDDDVAVLELGARGDQRADRVPSTNSGNPATGDCTRQLAAPRSYPQRLGGAAAAAAARRQLAGQRDHVGRGVEVEAQRGQLLDPEGDPGLAGGGDVAGAAALAEGGDDRVRRAQRQRVGAGRRGGRGRSRRSARGRRSAAGRARAGPAAGSRRGGGRRRSLPRLRRGRSRPARPRRGRRRSGSGTTSAPAAAASSCAAGSPLTTIVRSIVRASPIASSTSATIASIRVRRCSPSRPAASRCLAALKRLTGRTAVAFKLEARLVA